MWKCGKVDSTNRALVAKKCGNFRVSTNRALVAKKCGKEGVSKLWHTLDWINNC